MTKLKKLFPLSFTFCKNPVNILLGALIYAAISVVGGFLITTVFNIIVIPFTFLSLIPIIGWFIILPIFSFVSTLLTLVINAVTFLLGAYAYAGIAVAIINYVNAEEEAPVEEEATEETAEEAEATEEVEATEAE